MGSKRLSQAVWKWQSYLEKSPLYRQVARAGETPVWEKRAEPFETRSYSLSQQQLILSRLTADVDDNRGTAIEVGAGPGTFTLSLSKRFRRMTVIEPSSAMLNELEKRLLHHNISHVDMINKKWEDTIIEPHEYVFALGCLYAFYQIEEALIKMIRASKKRLVLLHLAGNGLWNVDYRVANAFHSHPPFYYPPAALLVNILSAMSLDFRIRVFQVPVHRKWMLSKFDKRYKRMFSLPQIDAGVLEKTLGESLEFYHGYYRVDEKMGFAVIDVDVAKSGCKN
jgi:hypothetical protein